ncbi:acyloxyacyl hydrolase [Shewanella woodyi]
MASIPSFIHYSNANLAQKNDGLSAVGFSYGFFGEHSCESHLR